MRPRNLTPLLTPPLRQFSPPSPLTKLFTTAASSLQPLSPPPPPSTTPTLRKCIALLRLSSSLPHLQQIHAHSIRTATPLSHPQLGKQLIFSLISLPSPPIPYAHRIFSLIPHPDIFTFNTLIRGYAESPDPRPALAVHRRLVSHPSPTATPDTHTYPFLLKACAKLHALRDGEAVHARSIINSFNTFVFVQNTLVHFYAACGLFEEAHQVFDGMSDRNLVTWNSVINGYAGNSRPNEALTLFHQMFPEQIPDGFTMVSLLSACAELGALALGRRVHVYIFKVGLNRNHHVGNSLIDLYAKCGTITDARRVFGEMRYKNVVSWTSLIVGLAANGCSAEALEMFEAMERENVAPSEITFVGVLYACSHHGLVDEGFRYFDKMKDQYRITPKIEHYGCMVDLLGRAGLVEEARDFIATMPLKQNAVLWRTLLGACATHKRVALAEAAWTELARLEPGHCGDYVLLSNIYATAGRWGEVHRLRRGMLKSGVRKKPGHSLFELGNCVHEFIMGDRSHPQCDEIYVMLEEIAMKLRVEGYMPVTVGVLADIEEEEKATALNYHSERLAIAFALLSTASGTPIRIVKNLRVCGDCHLVTKLISKIYGREIVVRDRSRFHHFRNGSCSCKDYW